MEGIKETIRISLTTLARHPKIFIPSLIFQSLGAMAAYLFLGEFLKMYDTTSMGASSTWTLWQILYYVFFFMATPFFEGWTYFVLNTWFTEERVSLQEGLLNALRKYFGFFALELIYYASSVIILLPLFFGFIFLLMGIMLSKVSGMNISSIIFIILIIIFAMMMLAFSITIQALLAFMKPVYVHVGDFFESVKESFYVARHNFWKTVYAIFIVSILAMLACMPSIMFFAALVRNAMHFEIAIYPLSSLHFPFWIFLNGAFAGIVTRTFLACAFTSFYLKYREWVT